MEDKILDRNEFRKQYRESKHLMIKEGKEAKYEYGCIMAKIDQQIQRPGLNIAHLYKPEDDRYGIEENQHITLLYGIESYVEEAEVIDFLLCLKMPYVSLTGISIFSNPEFDVVKYSVESPILISQNRLTTKLFPYTSNFPNYVPHLTISYMLPGTGSKYVRTFDELIILPVTSWIYSMANGRKIEVTSDNELIFLS